jgi:hypothetical protein
MARFDLVQANATGSGVRLLVSTLAVVMLPPFIAAAVIPLALLLFPVTWLAIPFIVTTLLGDALSAGAQPKPRQVARRASRHVVVKPAYLER